MHRIFRCALALTVAAAAFAQHKAPAVSPLRAESPRELPPGLRAVLPRPAEVALGDLDPREQALVSTRGRVPRIGVHRDMAVALSTGTWQTLADGSAVWRVAIHSRGAAGIRVQFSDFSVGSGNVWLYGDDAQAQGPYTGKGLFGNGEFWSGTIWGDTATVEFTAQTSVDRVPFKIVSIAHRVTARPGVQVRRNEVGLAGSQPWVDPAAGCNLDVSCYADWAGTAKSVSEIVFETEENGQQFEAACSASLLATRNDSFKPYLLTAGHCIHNEVDARTVETFWNYQTSQCGGDAPQMKNSTMSQPGANYLASGALDTGDYSLLLLKNVPGGVTFNGWDTGDVPLGASVASIHHPMASYKRISFGSRAADSLALIDGYNLPANLYYIVNLNKGIAEPGSSGSPLFSAPGVVVGMTSYGPSLDGDTLCALGSVPVGYGRFSVAYPSLMDWLEDLPYSEVIPSQADLTLEGANGIIAGGAQRTVMLTTQSATPVTFSIRSDVAWLQASASATITTAVNPATTTITVNPKMLPDAGSYVGTVTILSGAAPPQFINVRVKMTIDVSDVSASVNPSVVRQGSDGLWSYTIQVKENAAVDTRLTLVRIDGRDYSNNIVDWFGSALLPGSGSSSAPLKSRVVYAPATQTIEVGGSDVASHRTWYQVITVSLLPK